MEEQEKNLQDSAENVEQLQSKLPPFNAVCTLSCGSWTHLKKRKCLFNVIISN
jgi:hypothetical protein